MSIGIGHGKVIVCGEHFVLDGATALAVDLPSLVTQVHWAEAANESRAAIQIESDQILSAAETGQAIAMIAAAQRELGIDGGAMVTITSNVPVGRGLGSSAAFAVAMVRAMAAARGRNLSLAALIDACRVVEAIVHGSSSGIDPAAAAASGGVLFRNGEVQRSVSIARGGALRSARWLLVDVGSAPPTSVAIERANRARRRIGDTATASATATVDSASKAAAKALETDDVDGLAAAMRTCGDALKVLDVGDARMAHVAHQALAAGALAIKQTGAGLGGTMLALARSERIGETVARKLEHVADSAWLVEITR